MMKNFQANPKLTLTDFLELIHASLIRTRTLEQLDAGVTVNAQEANLREATARLMLDIVISLYDVNSSNRSNVQRISSNLETVVIHLEHFSKEIERLEAKL